MMAKTTLTVPTWTILLSTMIQIASSKSLRGIPEGKLVSFQGRAVDDMDDRFATTLSSSTNRVLPGELIANEIDFYWMDLDRDLQLGPINDGEWMLHTSSVAPAFTSRGPDPTIRLIFDNYGGSFYVTGVSYILYDESLVQPGDHSIRSIATRGEETTLNYHVGVNEILDATNDTQWYRFSVSETWGYVEQVEGVFDFSGMRNVLEKGDVIGIYPLDYVEGCDGCGQPNHTIVQERDTLIYSADAFGSTDQPSKSPTGQPSKYPSRFPTAHPSGIPSIAPSQAPTVSPTIKPSQVPTIQPSVAPSKLPSDLPSSVPSGTPSTLPTVVRKEESKGIINESEVSNTLPSDLPSSFPSDEPSVVPTAAPSASDFFLVDLPSAAPSDLSSLIPSDGPSMIPSDAPSMIPSDAPSMIPSDAPSFVPTRVA